MTYLSPEHSSERHEFDQPDLLTEAARLSIEAQVRTLSPGAYVEFGPGFLPYPIYDGNRKFTDDTPAYYWGIDGARSRYGSDIWNLNPRTIGMGAVGRTRRGGELESLWLGDVPATEVYGRVLRNLKEGNSRANILLGDARDAPLIPGRVREIFASEVLLSNVMYPVDVASIVASARKSLEPDGLFIVREGTFDDEDAERLIEEMRRAGFGEVFYVPLMLRTEEQAFLRMTLEEVFGTANGVHVQLGYFVARGFADPKALEALSKIPRLSSPQRAGQKAGEATRTRLEVEAAIEKAKRYSGKFGSVLRWIDKILGP